MTVAVTRTKAEQAFSHNFEAVAARLPGDGTVAEARKAAIGTFASLGLPHRRIEAWKYTDLRNAIKDALPPALPAAAAATRQDIDAALGPLARLEAFRVVFVDGAYSRALSDAKSGDGIEIAPLAALLAEPGRRDGLLHGTPGEDAVAALNTAFMTDGAVLRIAARTRVAKPVLIVLARSGRDAQLVTTRNVIEIGAGADATLVEVHVSLGGAAAGQVNALSQVTVGEGARFSHAKVTLQGEAVTHLATTTAAIAAEARYHAFQFVAGSGLVRNTMFSRFDGEGASLDISGCFLGGGSEHIDTTLVVDHAVPGCTSRELFKGVLAGRARGVFQGKVIVRPNAQKTDGKQMAQALMLSEEAEFDSKPELEIFADDVACGHGSTAAEIDPDLLFYLRSRGIRLEEARAILIQSFVGEAIEKIESEAVRTALVEIANSRLAGLTA